MQVQQRCPRRASNLLQSICEEIEIRVSRKIQIVATAAISLIAVAGCSSSGTSANAKSSSSAASVSSSSGPSSGAASTTSPNPSADSSSAPAPAPPPSEPAPAAAPPICAAANLAFKLGSSEGAAGSVYDPVIMTNQSAATCRLAGFPGVSFVAGDDGHQVGKPAGRDMSKPYQTVMIAPGSSAKFVVRIVEAGNYSSAACGPVKARGLRIYTPGETHSAFLPLSTDACSSMKITLLTTGPVTSI